MKQITFLLIGFFLATAWADDAYLAGLKKEYNLTDAQVTSLKNSGLPDPQLAVVSRLSKLSGKSIDDILKMRSADSKKGWGEIAKELGIPPKEIGQAVADSHRNEHSKKDGDDKDDGHGHGHGHGHDMDDHHHGGDGHHDHHDSHGSGKGH